MAMRSSSRHAGLDTLRLLRSATAAWFLCVAADFVLIVIRQNLLPPPDDFIWARRLDGALVVAVVVATAAYFHHKQRSLPTVWWVFAVGVFWVILSVISGSVCSLLLESRPALRVLITVLMGDSSPAHGWVWQTFLTAQLTALPALKTLEEGLLRLRTTRFERQF